MKKINNLEHVFIDVNIFQDLFGNLDSWLKEIDNEDDKIEKLSEEYSKRISALQALNNNLLKKEVNLLLPEQAKDEYIRGRGRTIYKMEGILENIVKNQKGIDKIKNDKNNKEITEKINLLNKEIESFNKKVTESTKKSIEKIKKEMVLVDKIILGILERNPIILTDKKILEKANKRHLKGNPPFETKNDNNPNKYGDICGDAIIWESLLSNCEEKKIKKIVIITHDKGWYDSDDKEDVKVNGFIALEGKKIGLSIKIYSTLGDFINKLNNSLIVPKDTIEKEKKIASYGLTTIGNNFYPLGNGTTISGTEVGSTFYPHGTVTISGLNGTSVINTSGTAYFTPGIINGTRISFGTGLYGLDPNDVTTVWVKTCTECKRTYSVPVGMPDNGKCSDCNGGGSSMIIKK